MSFVRQWLLKAASGSHAVGGQTTEEETMSTQTPEAPVIDSEAAIANARRKDIRAQAASTQSELDSLAAELYAELGSWAKVAEQLGYANGAVARRAGLRHRGRMEIND
jgi:hypothetical protein